MKRLLIIPINVLLATSTTTVCMEQQLITTTTVGQQKQWHNFTNVLKIENTIMRDLKNQHTKPKDLCKLALLHQAFSYLQHTQKALLYIEKYIPECIELQKSLYYQGGYVSGSCFPLADAYHTDNISHQISRQQSSSLQSACLMKNIASYDPELVNHSTPFGSIVELSWHHPENKYPEYSIVAYTPEGRAFIKKNTEFDNKLMNSKNYNAYKKLYKDYKKLFINDKNTPEIRKIAQVNMYISLDRFIQSLINQTVCSEQILANDKIFKTLFAHYNALHLTDSLSHDSQEFRRIFNAADHGLHELPSMLANYLKTVPNTLHQEYAIISSISVKALESLKRNIVNYGLSKTIDYSIKQFNAAVKPIEIQINTQLTQFHNHFDTLYPMMNKPSISDLINRDLIQIQLNEMYIKNTQNKPKNSHSRRKHQRQPQASTQSVKNVTTTTTTTTTTTSSSLQQTENSASAQKATNKENRTINNQHHNTPADTIVYHERVLQQNKNHNDSYHGFTLITVPYILKYGERKTWTNRLTGHQDDLYEMYGEIVYDNQTSQEFYPVQFAVCKGHDGVIYHIEMQPTEYNNQASYEIQYPRLSFTTYSTSNPDTDLRGSNVMSENDYIIKIYDPRRKETIYLYKINS